MSYIDRIQLVGETGHKNFILPDGKHTKKFYDVSEIDLETGEFSILDGQGNVVEYMDIMGTFTQNNTEVAKYLCHYALSSRYIPVRTCPIGDLYYSGLVSFPSKFLSDDKVRNFIKSQEDYRYKKLCHKKCFRSLFERFYYKHYISELWKEKMIKLNQDNSSTIQNENHRDDVVNPPNKFL